MIFLKKTALFLLFVLCAFASQEKVALIEKVIQQDPGNRGVSNFYTTALFDAAHTLEKSNHIAILTGFFIPSAQRPETDGPLGAVFLAESLIALGKKVTLVTDSYCLPSITACIDVLQNSSVKSTLTVELFPEKKEEQTTFVENLCNSLDCILSIERVGRSFDGTYRTMRAIDITAKTAPLDDLFIYAQNHPELSIKTVAIGDGGNEIGMGDKQEEVKKYIPNGEKIACTVPADHLIVTGVSNWGGYALAGALWTILDEEKKNGLSLDQVYPTNEEQYAMLQSMIDADCCDGVFGKSILSVDGLSWEVHAIILNQIREILIL